jgi:hypothetical protein
MKPTKKGGDCFEFAAKMIALNDGPGYDAMVKQLTPEQVADAKLVHALVTHPTTERRYTHAWVEAGGKCFEYSNGRYMVVEPAYRWLYYQPLGVKTNRPDEYRTYTREEALKHLVESGNYGPWEAFAETPDP